METRATDFMSAKSHPEPPRGGGRGACRGRLPREGAQGPWAGLGWNPCHPREARGAGDKIKGMEEA